MGHAFFFPEAYNPPSGFSCGRQSFSRRSPTVAVHFFSGFKLTTKGPGQKIKLDRKTPIRSKFSIHLCQDCSQSCLGQLAVLGSQRLI